MSNETLVCFIWQSKSGAVSKYQKQVEEKVREGGGWKDYVGLGILCSQLSLWNNELIHKAKS